LLDCQCKGVVRMINLSPLLESAYARAWAKALSSRPALEDEFFKRFYAGTEILKEIPIRIRTLLARELDKRFANVFPEDNVALICDDLDYVDILWLVEEEFSLPAGALIKAAGSQRLDGTFDELVKLVARAKSAAEKGPC